MMLSAVVVLLTVSKALSYNPFFGAEEGIHRPEILLAKWTPRDIYTLEKICQIAEVSKYRNPFETSFDNLEYENIFLNKLSTRKNVREIVHCCNKYTTTEKKQCMKEVRENYLDNYCDKGLNHICCKTEFENRYTCFAKNPFRRGVSKIVSPLELSEESWIPSTGRMLKEREIMKELAIENAENPYKWADIEDRENQYSYLEKINDIRGVFNPESRLENIAEEIYDQEREQRRWIRDNREDSIVDVLETVSSSPFERERELEREIRGVGIGGGILGAETAFEVEDAILGGGRRGLFGREQEDLVEEAILEQQQQRGNGLFGLGGRIGGLGEEWESVETLRETAGRCSTPNCRLESKLELENEILADKMIQGQRPCAVSGECRRRLEYATHAAAKQVCANKMYTGGVRKTETCCRAGALVGKMVGRKNVDVCTPAVFKFSAKTNMCTSPFKKPQCNQAFVECCRERAERAREERLIEKNFIRDRSVEKDLVREEFLEEPTFYQQRRNNPFALY